VSGCIEALNILMHHRFRHNWEISLPVLAGVVVAVAERHGDTLEDEDGFATTLEMIGPSVKGLVRLRTDVNDGASRHAVENAVSIIVAGIGMEAFLGVVSLEEGDGKTNKKKQKQLVGAIHPDRTWLLPVLKSASAPGSAHHRPKLAFFQGKILALARKCDAASAASSLTAAEAAVQRTRVIELWSLLPAFCGNPADVEITFPTLSQTLVKAVGDKRYLELVVSRPALVRIA
jgi:ribosomal RNA-processing protein 12